MGVSLPAPLRPVLVEPVEFAFELADLAVLEPFLRFGVADAVVAVVRPRDAFEVDFPAQDAVLVHDERPPVAALPARRLRLHALLDVLDELPVCPLAPVVPLAQVAPHVVPLAADLAFEPAAQGA